MQWQNSTFWVHKDKWPSLQDGFHGQQWNCSHGLLAADMSVTTVMHMLLLMLKKAK